MDLNQFFSAFLNAFLPGVLSVLGTTAAIWVIQQIRLLQAKIKAENPDVFEQLEWFAQAAVIAAEQANVKGLIADKKQYAIEVVETWLKQYNLNVDVLAIDAAVEKAVFEVINSEIE